MFNRKKNAQKLEAALVAALGGWKVQLDPKGLAKLVRAGEADLKRQGL